MRLVLALLASLLLAACGGQPARQADVASYDFGNLAGRWPAPLPIAAVEVRATSWLDSAAQLYRLDYADQLRRFRYADSRWAAPPAELLERFLQRRIVFGQPDFAGRGCRLALSLDELEQRFDDTQSSKTVLEVRARLLPANGDRLLSKRAFLIQRSAPSPDAHGGVVAARAAVQLLADEMGQWLAGVAQDKPQIAALCSKTD